LSELFALISPLNDNNSRANNITSVPYCRIGGHYRSKFAFRLLKHDFSSFPFRVFVYDGHCVVYANGHRYSPRQRLPPLKSCAITTTHHESFKMSREGCIADGRKGRRIVKWLSVTSVITLRRCCNGSIGLYKRQRRRKRGL